MRRKLASAVVLVLFVHLSSGVARAEPDVPAPDECTIVPRAQSDLLAQMSTPPSFPETSADPELLYGQPVSEEARDGIAATFREIIACNNAGDVQRMYSLYSDRLLARLNPDSAGLESNPQPLPVAERTAYLGVLSVYPLTDGRVGAVVFYHDPRVLAPAEAFFWIFAKSEDRWLWDELPDPYYSEVVVDGERHSADDA